MKKEKTMSARTVKHPEVKVYLLGQDGNAFGIIAKCMEAMRRAGLSKEERDAFQTEAMSGDYDHVLRTCLAWFEIA